MADANGEFQKMDRQFRDKSADLLRSDSHDFEHKLKVFVHFIENDPTLSAIVTPYLEREVGLKEWAKREGGRRGIGRAPGVDLPLDDDERLALILQLLGAIAGGEIDVLHIASAVSYDSKYDDLIRSFNDKFARLAVRDLGEKLRELSPAPSPASGGTVITTGAGSTSTIAVGSRISQTVGVSGGELGELLNAMRGLIEGHTDLSATEKAELADEVGILETEGRRTVPRSAIVMTVLQSLAAVPGLVELTGKLADLFHVTL